MEAKQKERWTERIIVYVTPAQKAQIEDKAARRGVMPAAKLRELALVWADDEREGVV